MRIWVIGRGYPTKKNKLLGSFEFEQAQMLARHGNEVYYPTVSLNKPRQGKKIGYVHKEDQGVHVVILTLPIGFLFPYKYQKKIKRFLQKILYRYMKRRYGLPEVMHVHYPTLYPYRLFKMYQEKGVKLVGTEHWSQVQDKTLPKDCLENLSISVEKYNAMICIGLPLAQSMKELTKTKKNIYIVPNIVSSIFTFSENQQEKKNQDFHFISVGRLIKTRRYDLMLLAFSEAFKENEHIKLDIIGEGSERSQLEKIIQKEHLMNQVSLLGVKSRSEVTAYYHQCDALVLASNLETFGVPVIEAMACGLPVVTTDAIGFLNLFNDRLGYVVPADDQHALATAMKKMYDQYRSFDREYISSYAQQHFSEDAVYQRLQLIYLDVMK